jgi:hypothetical protein
VARTITSAVNNWLKEKGGAWQALTGEAEPAAARSRKARTEHRAFARLAAGAGKKFPSQIILVSTRVKESPHDDQRYDEQGTVSAAHRSHLLRREMHPPALKLVRVLKGEDEREKVDSEEKSDGQDD